MDSKTLLANKKYQDILDAQYAKQKNDIEQKFAKDLANLNESRRTCEYSLNRELYQVIQGIKYQSQTDGVPDGFTYRQTTRDIRAKQAQDAKEKKRKDLLKQLRTLDK
jgi:hypothetical protein